MFEPFPSAGVNLYRLIHADSIGVQVWTRRGRGGGGGGVGKSPAILRIAVENTPEWH